MYEVDEDTASCFYKRAFLYWVVLGSGSPCIVITPGEDPPERRLPDWFQAVVRMMGPVCSLGEGEDLEGMSDSVPLSLNFKRSLCF